MKKILSILFIFSFFAANASYDSIPKYSPARSTGNVIVTDVAFRASEFMQLPFANVASPSIGNYVDSTGRVMYNRYDSTIIVRNLGTWLKFYNSVKINAMDALNAHLAGTETFTGEKIFNGNITSAGLTTLGNDLQWNNNTGYGLKGSDGVRYLFYTTATGGFMPTLLIGTASKHNGAPKLDVTGKGYLTDTLQAGTVAIIGGTSSQYLMADGSTTTVSGGITSGTYTPTIANNSYTSSLTAYQAQYLRVGNTITVSGVALVTTTNTGSAVSFTLSLPFNSTTAFGTTSGGSGTCWVQNSPVGGTVVRNGSSSVITVFLNETAATANRYVNYHYTYLVD